MSHSQQNSVQVEEKTDDTEATGSGDDISESPYSFMEGDTDATNATSLILDTRTESQQQLTDDEGPTQATSPMHTRRGSRKRRRVSYYGQFEEN